MLDRSYVCPVHRVTGSVNKSRLIGHLNKWGTAISGSFMRNLDEPKFFNLSDKATKEPTELGGKDQNEQSMCEEADHSDNPETRKK